MQNNYKATVLSSGQVEGDMNVQQCKRNEKMSRASQVLLLHRKLMKCGKFLGHLGGL